MSDTTEPAPLTEREMNQFVTLAALPTLERALERLRWLEAQNAALKAHDPLAEMWAALAEYQPQADRDGHGESWRKMCEERTGDWAWAAKLEARKASQDAAWAAADAVARALADATEWAVEVIEAIRRAKEEQR
jgi:hypothetical protein